MRPILSMIMSLALASELSLQSTQQKNNPFCFSRSESEEIYQCLKLRDDYMKYSPQSSIATPEEPSKVPWYITFFAVGVVTGYIIKK